MLTASLHATKAVQLSSADAWKPVTRSSIRERQFLRATQYREKRLQKKSHLKRV
jgi:hypothetical protein